MWREPSLGSVFRISLTLSPVWIKRSEINDVLDVPSEMSPKPISALCQETGLPGLSSGMTPTWRLVPISPLNPVVRDGQPMFPA